VYAPALLVVPDATVDQVLEVDGRRCTLTDLATYPVPVLTDTASLITYPIAPLVAVVDHPATVVADAACAGTDTPTNPTHATTSATHTRRHIAQPPVSLPPTHGHPTGTRHALSPPSLPTHQHPPPANDEHTTPKVGRPRAIARMRSWLSPRTPAGCSANFGPNKDYQSAGRPASATNSRHRPPAALVNPERVRCRTRVDEGATSQSRPPFLDASCYTVVGAVSKIPLLSPCRMTRWRRRDAGCASTIYTHELQPTPLGTKRPVNGLIGRVCSAL
jgi:hypothetical protein